MMSDFTRYYQDICVSSTAAFGHVDSFQIIIPKTLGFAVLFFLGVFVSHVDLFILF